MCVVGALPHAWEFAAGKRFGTHVLLSSEICCAYSKVAFGPVKTPPSCAI